VFLPKLLERRIIKVSSGVVVPLPLNNRFQATRDRTKPMANIATLVDNLGEAFVTLAIVGLIITVVFGLDVAGSSNSSLLADLETEVNDGMTTIAGVIVVIAVIFVLRMMRARA
jgi:p-aminobenzoyl-glutamate transporter AbgT